MGYLKSTFAKDTALAVATAAVGATANAADITLRGASLFDEEHA